MIFDGMRLIVDKAGQKGTGLWTAVSSLQLGSPSPTIAEAVYARSLSALKSERVKAATVLAGPAQNLISPEQKDEIIQALHDAALWLITVDGMMVRPSYPLRLLWATKKLARSLFA